MPRVGSLPNCFYGLWHLFSSVVHIFDFWGLLHARLASPILLSGLHPRQYESFSHFWSSLRLFGQSSTLHTLDRDILLASFQPRLLSPPFCRDLHTTWTAFECACLPMIDPFLAVSVFAHRMPRLTLPVAARPSWTFFGSLSLFSTLCNTGCGALCSPAHHVTFT